MMPDAAELARMRADMQAATLPDTCNILSLTRTPDGEGGWTDTWGTASASISCRLDLVITRGVGFIGSEQIQSASLKPYSSWVLSVPHGTAITSANRVEVGSDTFNVVECDASRSWAGNVRATLERL